MTQILASHPLIAAALALGGGVLALVWGADRFVAGAAALARGLGVSTLVIGLTVVAIGTSAPEILVSTMAALAGNPELAMGNAIGSNIANIGLILGVTGLVAPLTVRSATLRREFPVLLLVMLGTLLLLADGRLGRLDGALLVAAMVALLAWLVRTARRGGDDALQAELEAEIPSEMRPGRALLLTVAGLVVLLGGSRAIVWGGVAIATHLGVSELVIGLTIVAVGTSLPELASSVAGALRGEPDIAIGNVIGSNMFNLLAVLPVAGLVAPGPVPGDLLARDLPVMNAITLALFVMAYGLRGPGRIGRGEGALLLAAFTAYLGWLYHQGSAP
ncbi:calcium/sodium antiporter [Inmirania thermothiophila]|uniref:Cation:H+ antiporter n=1 Tax=Inmirania thermothiophila TaxID=1750597 RepID=A0A3N1XSY7_9GAMM|nr:calcium/sodium antiporter [Inmirania thermothiophila]ROR29764.1 cation:H+ antiporter [Inmirania thermothiophila]